MPAPTASLGIVTFKKELKPILHKFFQIADKAGARLKSSQASDTLTANSGDPLYDSFSMKRPEQANRDGKQASGHAGWRLGGREVTGMGTEPLFQVRV